jgi:transposase-like protein
MTHGNQTYCLLKVINVSRRQWRSFTRDFKLSALKQMAETDNLQALAQELEIERRLLYC